MNVIERVKTPPTLEQIRPWVEQQFAGDEALINLAAMALAQTYLETGGWQSLYNWNVGNLTAGESYAGNVYRPAWYELGPDSSDRLHALHEQMSQGRAPQAFRAYESLAEGVADYVHELRARYPEIVAAFKTGRASAVATAINRRYCKGCFGGAETDGLRSLAARFGAVPEKKKEGELA